MSETKPCPFCGGTDLEVRDADKYTDAEVVCMNDSCGASVAYGKTRDAAVAVWNRRAAPEPAPGQKAAMSESRITTYIVFARDKHGRERKISIPWVGRHEPTTSDISRAIVYALGDDSPEPAPDDRERAKEFEGSLNAFSERKDVRERLAAEFARVRAEATKAERERCARVCERLQAGNNAEFDHANGRDAKRAALMLGLAEGAADCAAAIRKGEP